MDTRKYGSQGQQRTAALSFETVGDRVWSNWQTHDTPILLFDDVLSELDKHRQNYLLDSIHDIQTLITCTGVEDFVNHRFSINKVFHVQNGQVTKRKLGGLRMGTEKVQHEYGADEIQILKVLRQSANVLVCTLKYISQRLASSCIRDCR